MAQYIDKDALVAEIEKAIDEPAPSHDQQCPWEDGYYCGLNRAESIIENLEVKEVDLEKEIELTKGDYEQVDVAWNNDFDFIARHFFELGMQQSKNYNNNEEIKIGETEIYLEDDGGEPPYDGIQWLDLSCMEYEIPKDKFKDGDNVEIIIRKAQKG